MCNNLDYFFVQSFEIISINNFDLCLLEVDEIFIRNIVHIQDLPNQIITEISFSVFEFALQWKSVTFVSLHNFNFNKEGFKLIRPPMNQLNVLFCQFIWSSSR